MDRDHVISVVLSTEDWKAFLESQPQPVEWLRERIRESISAAPPQQARRPKPIKH
ncbi:MAG: hypothetical protein AB7O67_22015 [Vicinamibacterales bacterium]